jgi:hypothetical protein
MKTIKLLLPVAALFISAIAFGQKSNGHQKKNNQTSTYSTGEDKREQARTNGTINANANANERAKARANENSVLNESGTTQRKYKTKGRTNSSVKRTYARKNK